MDSQRTHNGLTMDSQWTHNGLTMDSQRTHNGLTKDSQRTHTKIIEKALVLLGCPRKMMFLHWFYKVVREKCCFYTVFMRLSAKNVVFLHWFYEGCPRNMVFYIGFTRKTRGQLADNPARFWHSRRENGLTTGLASQSNRLSLAHTASPRLARSHARPEPKPKSISRLDSPPPTSNVENKSV